MKLHNNSKNKNRKIYFSYDSAHCASFMKMGAKLREGGVCISLLGTGPLFEFIVILFAFNGYILFKFIVFLFVLDSDILLFILEADI